MSHIALLLPDLEVGGAQRVMLLLAKEFIARGHHVDMVVLHASGPLSDSIPPGVNMIDIGARRYGLGVFGFTVSSVMRLAAWLKRTHPDVVLSSINGANIVSLLVRKFYSISTRVVVRETASVATIAKGVRLRVMRWLYPEADCAIVLNSVMVKELEELVGVPKEKISRISNPIDEKFILEQAKAPLNHLWVGGEEQNLVISVGRLVPEKDYPVLVKAFALLPGKLNARLIIIGEGKERDSLESLVRRLKVQKSVQLIGFDANPWRWIAHARLFVLASNSEGYPNSLMEALVLGVPAVVTEYDYSAQELATRYGFEVIPVGQETLLAQSIEEQLCAEVQQRRRPLDRVEDVVSDYLNALGCSSTVIGKM
jgi:glycosyltransferase involved in cell wall biosynthesis